MSEKSDNASGAGLETHAWAIFNSLTGQLLSVDCRQNKPSADDRWQALVRRTDASRLLAEKEGELQRLMEHLKAVLSLPIIRNEFGYLNKGIGVATPMGRTLLAARAAIKP